MIPYSRKRKYTKRKLQLQELMVLTSSHKAGLYTVSITLTLYAKKDKMYAR